MFGFGGSSSAGTSTTSTSEADFSNLAGPSESSFDMKSSSMPIQEPSSSGVDVELQRTLMIEQQRAQFQAQIHKLTDLCWDVCMDRPKSTLDSKTETCFANCTERFLDHTIFVTKRFAQLLEKSAGY